MRFVVALFTGVICFTGVAAAQDMKGPLQDPTFCSALVQAVANQRNLGLGQAAEASAQIAILTQKNAALEKQVVDLQKQVAPAKPDGN